MAILIIHTSNGLDFITSTIQGYSGWEDISVVIQRNRMSYDQRKFYANLFKKLFKDRSMRKGRRERGLRVMNRSRLVFLLYYCCDHKNLIKTRINRIGPILIVIPDTYKCDSNVA